MGSLSGTFLLIIGRCGPVSLARFVEEGLDDPVFGHGFDDFAANEDLALAVAGGDAKVGFACFAGAVDDTAHDGDAQRDGKALEDGDDSFGEGVDVDLGSPARRSGHDLQAPGSQAERFQDLAADFDFLDRWGSQRHADGVADPLGQQHPEGDGGFDGALKQRSGLSYAQVQRVVAARGQ